MGLATSDRDGTFVCSGDILAAAAASDLSGSFEHGSGLSGCHMAQQCTRVGTLGGSFSLEDVFSALRLTYEVFYLEKNLLIFECLLISNLILFAR